jgi:hypothetical protein
VLRCPCSFRFRFIDRSLKREHFVYSFLYGKSGLEIAHLLAQHPSRVVIHGLTRGGGILFETRYRAGQERIIIPWHRFLSIHPTSLTGSPALSRRREVPAGCANAVYGLPTRRRGRNWAPPSLSTPQKKRPWPGPLKYQGDNTLEEPRLEMEVNSRGYATHPCHGLSGKSVLVPRAAISEPPAQSPCGIIFMRTG